MKRSRKERDPRKITGLEYYLHYRKVRQSRVKYDSTSSEDETRQESVLNKCKTLDTTPKSTDTSTNIEKSNNCATPTHSGDNSNNLVILNDKSATSDNSEKQTTRRKKLLRTTLNL